MRSKIIRNALLYLPLPLAHEWQWQLRARCRDERWSSLFDSDDTETVDAAKKVCLDCPVLEQCRDHAINANEPYGVWGALASEERNRLRWAFGSLMSRHDRYRPVDT
ncbi:hypothetical protein CH253_07135 [Rhodococcus sp. 06-156-3C]|uniref:WhiB family transcriptional regulator n=1 Tax=Nocardiaceae TaxID=85025 RepID=UPI000B9B7724|nr:MULTISPECIES: WhiB family transcriptional regulator [Rhodococcus]OZD11634.1 hypothetical protein CH280_17755 [Rhodococcus sp. 06-156-4C]OZD15476.1 hypothetical protein CH248_22375 [Rhodococcus sp. 06-156-4a]OZD23642.1 hypothetical protein CH253_07135 [Rhodococcus sp. 06-156-3C]OZD27286.1 hypothetical protein CH247_23245 [Rhodococcus sp. 06-156-3b]OZD31318.1 hypothetical protein CH284_21200 [Rhodococcus sp. 06-156-3]